MGWVSHAKGADSRVESGRNKVGSEAEVEFGYKGLNGRRKGGFFFPSIFLRG